MTTTCDIITIQETAVETVEIHDGPSGIADAPRDGTAYARQDGSWISSVRSVDVRVLQVVTQAAYDAIDTPDPNTLYIIVG